MCNTIKFRSINTQAPKVPEAVQEREHTPNISPSTAASASPQLHNHSSFTATVDNTNAVTQGQVHDFSHSNKHVSTEDEEFSSNAEAEDTEREILEAEVEHGAPSSADTPKKKVYKPIPQGVTKTHRKHGLCVKHDGTWELAILHSYFIKQLPMSTIDPKQYDVIPKRGKRDEDFTAFLEEQKSWSFAREDRPDILFQLREPARKPELPDVELLFCDDNGKRRIVIDDYTLNPILAFLNIPLQVSTQIEGFRMEAIMRQDPRIGYEDFRVRMLLVKDRNGRDHRPSRNTLSMRRIRFRQEGRCLSWEEHQNKSSWDEHLLSEMREEWIKLNTTRHLEDLTVRQRIGLEAMAFGKHPKKAGKRALQGKAKAKKEKLIRQQQREFQEEARRSKSEPQTQADIETPEAESDSIESPSGSSEVSSGRAKRNRAEADRETDRQSPVGELERDHQRRFSLIVAQRPNLYEGATTDRRHSYAAGGVDTHRPQVQQHQRQLAFATNMMRSLTGDLGETHNTQASRSSIPHLNANVRKSRLAGSVAMTTSDSHPHSGQQTQSAMSMVSRHGARPAPIATPAANAGFSLPESQQQFVHMQGNRPDQYQPASIQPNFMATVPSLSSTRDWSYPPMAHGFLPSPQTPAIFNPHLLYYPGAPVHMIPDFYVHQNRAMPMFHALPALPAGFVNPLSAPSNVNGGDQQSRSPSDFSDVGEHGPIYGFNNHADGNSYQ